MKRKAFQVIRSGRKLSTCHHQNAGQNHKVKAANKSFTMGHYLNIWEQQWSNKYKLYSQIY